MRKIILLVLFAISLWWYVYRFEDRGFKGLKRALLMALVLLGGPTSALGESEVDAFIFPLQKPVISGKGLFGSSSAISEITPDNNDGFGSPRDDNNLNSEAKSIEKNVEKSEKPIEHPYYHQPVQNQDDESDSDEQCLVTERLKISVSHDGSMTNVPASKVRDKSLHIPELVSKERLEGKFDITKVKDLEYEDRLNYLRDEKNLPDEIVFEAQDKIVEFLSAKDTVLVPGFLGSKKIRGTVFINLRLNQFGFRDQDSYDYRTAGHMSDNKIRKLAEADFHLFPTAGE
jgi:hypothetical protein